MSLLAIFYLLDTLYASFASTKGQGNLPELSVPVAIEFEALKNTRAKVYVLWAEFTST